MENSCLVEELVGKVNNYKLPTLIEDIDYSSLLSDIQYEVGKYWKDSGAVEKRSTENSFYAAINPVSITTNNGVMISCKSTSYGIKKVSITRDGTTAELINSDAKNWGYKVAVDEIGTYSLLITIATLPEESANIPSNLDLSTIVEIKTQENPYINNELVEAIAICSNATEGQTAYDRANTYEYFLLNYNSPKLVRKEASNGPTKDTIDTERTKTVKIGDKYYRYNGTLYVEIE